MSIDPGSAARFGEWCGRIDGLEKVGDTLWRARNPSPVSYPVDDLEEIAEVEAGSFWFRHRNRVICSTVRRLPPPGPILDIGGGNGFVALALRRAGFETFAVEPAHAGARACVRRGIPVVHAAFEDLAIPSGTVHAAAMFDVIEHVERDSDALLALRGTLVPEGRLYLTVPAFGALWSAEDQRAGHFRRYRLPELRRKLESTGFRVEYETYFFRILVAPLFVMRTLGMRMGKSSGTEPADLSRSHTLPSNAIGTVIERSLAREGRNVAAGGRVRFGTSCLVVAKAC